MKKIKEEYLKELQEKVNNINTLLHNIGLLEVQKAGLFSQFSSIDSEFNDLKTKLNDEYGDAVVDINTGEIKDNTELNEQQGES